MNKVEGYAIEPGVSHGQSGLEREWGEDELRESVETLVGVPIVKESGFTESMAPVGEVTDAKYVGDKGLWYEAEIWDDDVAIQIDEGAELSPQMIVDEVDLSKDPPYTARNIEFRSLFLTMVPSENVPGVER